LGLDVQEQPELDEIKQDVAPDAVLDEIEEVSGSAKKRL
jgi:hypothetical protein